MAVSLEDIKVNLKKDRDNLKLIEKGEINYLDWWRQHRESLECAAKFLRQCNTKTRNLTDLKEKLSIYEDLESVFKELVKFGEKLEYFEIYENGLYD